MIMAETIKETLEKTGNRISEKAAEVGHTVGEKLEQASDWAKEKSHEAGNAVSELSQKAENKYQETFGNSCGATKTSADISEHMDVMGSCGNMLGRVDRVEGSSIKLTRSDSSDGRHHFIPMSWVDHVDSHVHLNKNCGAAEAEWQTI